MANNNWKTKDLNILAETLASINDKKDMLKFLRDLCTLEELQELSSRWKAANLLNDGMSYREVAKNTGLSTTTVTRIAQWLWHGEGGYLLALKKRE